MEKIELYVLEILDQKFQPDFAEGKRFLPYNTSPEKWSNFNAMKEKVKVHCGFGYYDYYQGRLRFTEFPELPNSDSIFEV